MKRFADRRQAGQELASLLTEYADRNDVVVLALPRGGVPVGCEVATRLHAPLDVLTVRKLGAPWNQEFAIGAIASGGLVFIDQYLLYELRISPQELEPVIQREMRELVRRDRLYRGDRSFPPLAGKCVILVDDGLATGATMRAAVLAVRETHPASVIVAAPLAAPEARQTLAHVADRVVCVATPEPFFGVGLWYDDFSETSDREVLDLLERAAAQPQPSAV